MNFIDAIFCDDVRQEINNKLSLIGVYNNKIVLNIAANKEISWPQPINLSALLRFSLDANDEIPNYFEFEYLLNNKTTLNVKNNLGINPTDKSLFQLVIRALIPIAPGHLGFSIRLYSGKKLLFSEKKENVINVLVSA